MIKSGDKVRLHYTGKMDNGVVFESSLDRDPIEFTLGAGEIIEGLETGVIGLKKGDKTTVTIEPEKGYGLVKEDMILTVSRSKVPPDVQVGSQLQATGQNGELIPFLVKEVNDENVVIDANHPLSGKTLLFEVEIVDIF